jgi:hypothetical protein
MPIIGFLDDLRDDQGSEGLLAENMLARALAEPGTRSVAERRLRRPCLARSARVSGARLAVEAEA